MLLSLIFLSIPTIKKELFKYKFLFVILCVLIFVAGSRTGMLCLAGLFAIYATRKFSIMAKLTIIFGIFVFLFYEIHSIIEYFNAGNGSSLNMRTDQLLFALKMFFQNPLYGNGTGYMAENIFEVDAYGEKKLVDHSIGALESFLFRLLIDFGVIGVAAQVILIGFLLFYFYRRRKECTAAISGLYITLSTYIFVFLAGDSVGTFRFTFLIIGLCLGNCVSHDIENKEKQEEREDDAYLESDGNKESNLSEERLSLN
jgi:O-antigen ligase